MHDDEAVIEMTDEFYQKVLDSMIKLKDPAKFYEQSHMDADQILLEFCPPEIKDAYEAVGKWYS